MKIGGSISATWVPFRFGGPLYNIYTETGKQPENYGSYDALGNWIPTLGWSKGDIFSGADSSVQVSFSGQTDYAGFGVNINTDSVGDASLWVRPFGTDLLKFSFRTSKGINISSVPLEGLNIGLTIPNGNKYYDDDDDPQDGASNADGDNAWNRWVAANMWRSIEVSAGYSINIGSGSIGISAGYNGGWGGTVNLNSPTKTQRNNLLGYQGISYDGSVVDYTGNVDDLLLSIPWDTLESVVWATGGIDLIVGGDRNSDGIDFGGDTGDYAGRRTNFKAGISVNDVIKGLGINLNTQLFMPMTAKADFADGADKASVSVKSAGGVNLGLGVSYALLDGKVSISFGASANHLGRANTYTASGSLSGDSFSADVKVTAPIESSLSLGTSVKVTDKINIGFGFGIDLKGETKVSSYSTTVGSVTVASDPRTLLDSTIKYNFGVDLGTSISGINLGVGFKFVTPEMWTATYPDGTGKGPKTDSRFYITVPITVGYSF